MRYLLFVYDRYYPDGGWNDYKRACDYLEPLIKEARWFNGELAHIVDTLTRTIVLVGEREYDWDADENFTFKEPARD